MSSSAAPFILPSDEQYDGSNWYQFKERIRAVAEQRGTLDYLDGKIPMPDPPNPKEPAPTPTTYWGDDKPSLNVKNTVGLGVKTDGTAAEARIKYTEGSKMEEHIAKLRTAWTKANAQGCAITDARFRMIILDSLPDSWMIFISTLRTETKSSGVIACLIEHATMLAARAPISNSSSAQAMAAQGRQSRNQDLICANPVCGRRGHTEANCFKPGGGMAGQYPDWWKKRGGGGNGGSNSGGGSNSSAAAKNIAASAVSDPNVNFAYATSTEELVGGEIITYADSAASGYFFVQREDFEEYHPRTESGETANGGEFFIAGVGRVTKRALYKGQIVHVTFNNAQHTPNLRHNLVSIGRLDQKGFHGIRAIGGWRNVPPYLALQWAQYRHGCSLAVKGC